MVEPRDIPTALRPVRQNQGGPGMDGMTVKELPK
jgi:hypothetical protein